MAPQLEERSQDKPPALLQDVLKKSFELIERRLPPAWSAQLQLDADISTPVGPDALIELKAPDGALVRLVVEAKRSLATRDLPQMHQRIQTYLPQLQNAEPLVIARYLAPSAREWLEKRNVSYADATGNVWLSASRPALFLRDVGADRDPWRGPGRPRGTLKGPPAARVVRALIDYAAPPTVPELVRRSGASTGATYRVVEFLEGELLVEREARGVVTVPSWRGLLERWSRDYGFQSSNPVGGYLEPRGSGALQDKLRQADGLDYALTGSLAAQHWAPFAPAKLAMLYVDDADVAVQQLQLREVDTGANVLLASATASVVFERTIDVGGLRYVAHSQAAVDLLTAPGRGPSEAQALLDWMEAHERKWRR